MSTLLWLRWSQKIRLITKLLPQTLSLLINLSLLPSPFLLFSLLLPLLLFEVLERLTLLFCLTSSSRLLQGFSLALLFTCLRLHLRLQPRSLGVNLPLCARV